MDGACPGSSDRGLSDVGVLVMEMMIGGAFQGKSALAEKRYPQVNWINGADADWEMLSCAKGVQGFHEYIRKEMKAGRSVDQLAEDLITVDNRGTPRLRAERHRHRALPPARFCASQCAALPHG